MSLRHHASRLLAVAVMVPIYCASMPPTIGEDERREAAERFRFTEMPLFVSNPGSRSLRPVHPTLRDIEAWISAVGASAALGDLDGDGRSNDVCYVHTPSDEVIVTPTPGRSAAYAPFVAYGPSSPGATAAIAPMGCLVLELNMDGRRDLLIYFWGRPPIALLRRESGELALDGFVAREIGDASERWFTNAATSGDIDGDGFADLIFGNYFPDDARILDANDSSRRESMHASMSRAHNGGNNRLLRWSASTGGDDPTVEFEDLSASLEAHLPNAWTLAIGAADLDGDQLPELYFANDFGPDVLLHNRSEVGRPDFQRVFGEKRLGVPSSKVMGHDSFKGMGVDFGDVNNDGVLDLYVSNIAADFALHESHFLFVSEGDISQLQSGTAPYVDRSEALGVSRTGWSWDSKLADFDNDGVLEAVQATGFVRGRTDRWPELHELAMANDALLRFPIFWPRFRAGDDLSGRDRNAFFVRTESGRFEDLATDVGLGSERVARGIALADTDRDGDLDLVFANQWDTSVYARNEGPAGRPYLGLELSFPAPNVGDDAAPSARRRPAIGATARIRDSRGREQMAFVDGGNGHSGARSPEMLFGLGDGAEGRVRVELSWRMDGSKRSRVIHLEPGWHHVTIE